jgi:hypothetical protein
MVMADFIFRVASVNLTAAQQQKIATAIQGAVLAELAQLDLGASSTPNVPGGSSGDFLYRPLKWYGGIMIPPGEVATVQKAQLTVATQV